MRNIVLILLIFIMAGSTVAADSPSYAFSKTVDMSYKEAITAVTEELKKEGFGIVTEIDAAATMKSKLDVDMRPYIILGACNPQFAHDAIQAEPQIGLFLPCNVIVYVDDAGKTVVSAVDPAAMMKAVDNAELHESAKQVGTTLKAVIERL